MASHTKVAQRLAEMSHDDVAVRRKAALKLGEYGDPEALPLLCAALLQDESWKVQRNAAIALGSFRDPASIEALASVFIESPRKRKYRSLRKAALYALGQIGTQAAVDVIAPIWLGEPSAVREAARDALRVARYAPAYSDRSLREAARDALRECGLIAVPVVCKALAAEPPAESPQSSVLTPKVTAFGITSEIALHAMPGHHAEIRNDALRILHSMVGAYHTEVFAAILAAEPLSPRDKFVCLETLRRRPFLFTTYISDGGLTAYYRDTRVYCEHLAATSNSDEVRAGARAVLDYASLIRGSIRPAEGQGDELLRAAQASVTAEEAEELLRGSGVPDVTPVEPDGLVARALRLFKRSS